MQFEIERNVLEVFPHITIGVVLGSIRNARPELQSRIARLRSDALRQLSTNIPRSEDLLSRSSISVWRNAYQRFGVKAKTHKPTHEALARRLLKDGVFPNINPIVDIYLSNQAAHLLPHGGYDLEAISGALRLTISEGGEAFEPLGGGEEQTAPNELVYRDDKRILTRRWNYRDCDVSKITDRTSNFILMIESPSEELEDETVEKAAQDLVEKYKGCFEGTFNYALLQASQELNRFTISITE